MTKQRRAWGILSGALLLPFTIRASRQRAIDDRLEARGFLGMLGHHTTPKQFHETIPYEHVVALEITWKLP